MKFRIFADFLLHNIWIISGPINGIGNPTTKKLQGPFGRVDILQLVVFWIVPVDIDRDSNFACTIKSGFYMNFRDFTPLIEGY